MSPRYIWHLKLLEVLELKTSNTLLDLKSLVLTAERPSHEGKLGKQTGYNIILIACFADTCKQSSVNDDNDHPKVGLDERR